MAMKIDREVLAGRIRELEGLSMEERSALLELLNTKKYGLVWENHEEAVEEHLREYLPVLKEDTNKALTDGGEDAPNHILIEGDNLDALTALTYTHEGKVDVIYIDPPYNTGNKDFVYNDSFVDSEDGYRHSKWLSFMEKRLKIAKKLLSDKGVIFISIDDNEQANLKLLCDEVFGERNFVGAVVWFKKRKGSFLSNKLVSMTEYLLPYVKDPSVSLYGGTPNNTESQPIVKRTNSRKVLNIKGGIIKTKLPNGIYTRGTYGEGTSGSILLNDVEVKDGVIINDISIEAPFVWSQEFLEQELRNGTEILINTKNFQIRVIRHNNDSFKAFPSFIDGREFGATNEDAYELLKQIFAVDSPFSYSKPVNLVKKVIDSASHFKKDAIVLDFFAGSGTTLHATMQLNAEDGGHRQCILVTNNENNICEEVTYERNKRVIQGYTTPKGVEVEGLKQNNLRYYKVDFVPRDNSLTGKRKLMEASTELICIKHDIYNEVFTFGSLKLRPHIARYFEDRGQKVLIIYKEEAIEYFVKEIAQMPEGMRIMVYVFSTNNYALDADFEEVADKVTLCALPAAIYNAYLKVLPKKNVAVEAANGKVEDLSLFNGEEDEQ